MADQTLTEKVANDPNLRPILDNLGPDEQAVVIRRVAKVVARHSGAVTPRVDRGPTGQRFRLWNNYYSAVRFQATVSSVPPVTTLTFPVGEFKPFSYRIGESLTSAGFDATLGNATDADTNLVKANETVAGEMLTIAGVSIMPSSVTDIGLWKQLLPSTSISISMDGGGHTYKLGRPDMIPGSGGTFGGGATPTIVPDLASGTAFDQAFSNGWPTVDNYYPFPEPIIWSPSGETDSNFSLVIALRRQQVIVETARAAVGTSVAAFTPPTAVGQFGTFVDYVARLHSDQSAARSVNS
jgi:hypothetical protein